MRPQKTSVYLIAFASLVTSLLGTAVVAAPASAPALQATSINPSDLLIGLVDYWKLDESSGSVVGAYAGKAFSEIGSVGSNAGRVYATAREYSGPGTSDSHVRDNGDVRFGDTDFTIALWWYQYTTPDGAWPRLYHYLIHQDGYDGGYTIGLNGANQLFFMSARGNGVTDVLHSSVLATPNNTWHLAVCWYTSSDDVLHAVIDNGVEQTSQGGARAIGSNLVRIGGRSDTNDTMDGRIGPIQMWRRVLTSDERSRLWNNGSGLSYEAMQSTTPTSTPLPPTATSTPTPTNTSLPPTATNTPTPTNTLLPPTATNTPTPTSTPLPPTATTTPTPTSTSTPTPLPDLIFRDGFESGNLTAWTSSFTNGGALSVSSSSALVGTYGLQAAINNNTAMYVADDNPDAEARYRARFYFDPNSIAMRSGNSHYIFYGYSGTSTIVLRIEFRYSSSSYQLRAGLVNDGKTWSASSWFTIADAPHYVEIDWQAATAPGANNGYLTLWIDGNQRASLTGVDNDTRRLDRVRLGPVAEVDSGTRGVYYLDAFESRRFTYIGP